MITVTDTHTALLLFHLREAELHTQAEHHRLATTQPRRGLRTRWARLRYGPQRRHGRAGSRAPALP